MLRAGEGMSPADPHRECSLPAGPPSGERGHWDQRPGLALDTLTASAPPFCLRVHEGKGPLWLLFKKVRYNSHTVKYAI